MDRFPIEVAHEMGTPPNFQSNLWGFPERGDTWVFAFLLQLVFYFLCSILGS